MTPKEILNALVDYNNLLQSKDKTLIKAVFANANSIEFPHVNFTNFNKQEEVKLHLGLNGNTLIGILLKGDADPLSEIISGGQVFVAPFTNSSSFTTPPYQNYTETAVDSFHAMSVINTWLNKKDIWVDSHFQADALARVFVIPRADVLNDSTNIGYIGLITDERGELELDLITSNETGLFDVVRCSPPYGGWPPLPGEPKPKDTKPKPKNLQLADN